MAGWTNRVSGVGTKLEKRLDALTYHLRKRTGSFDRVQILPYRGFGNAKEFYLKGRVLSERERPSTHLDPQPSDATPTERKEHKERVWRNVLATYRRFNSVEVSRAVVRVTFGNESHDVLTNSDGFFELHLANNHPATADPWREIKLELLSPKSSSKDPVTSTALAIVPPTTARFGIISDIDDTIILSHATSLLKVAYTTF